MTKELGFGVTWFSLKAEHELKLKKVEIALLNLEMNSNRQGYLETRKELLEQIELEKACVASCERIIKERGLRESTI